MKARATLLAALALSALSGCAVFGDDVVGGVVKGVDKYCEEPRNSREFYRTNINAALAAEPGGGESIVVRCDGDPAE